MDKRLICYKSIRNVAIIIFYKHFVMRGDSYFNIVRRKTKTVQLNITDTNLQLKSLKPPLWLLFLMSWTGGLLPLI